MRAVGLGSQAHHDGAFVGFVFTGDDASDFSIGVAGQIGRVKVAMGRSCKS